MTVMDSADLAAVARAFLKDPSSSSFEEVYQLIWNAWDVKNEKELLKDVVRDLISEVCTDIMGFTSESEHIIELWKYRFDYFREKLAILTNLFVFYDSVVEEPEENVAARARRSIEENCFQTRLALPIQNDVRKIFHAVLDRLEPMHECIKPVSHFMFCVSHEWYDSIFDRILQEVTEVSFAEAQWHEEDDHFVAMLYESYTKVHAAIKENMEKQSVDLFNGLFNRLVVEKHGERLVSEKMVSRCCEDLELLRELHFVVSLGPKELYGQFVKMYVDLLKRELDKCGGFGTEDEFSTFAANVARIYTSTQDVIRDCFGSGRQFASAINSAFVKFLTDKNFGHELCLFINKRLAGEPWIETLGRFVKNDPAFEDLYITLLARRLLGPKPDLEREKSVIEEFKAVGVVLDKAERMLVDIARAERKVLQNDTATVDLVVLFGGSWPMLHPVDFALPEPFNTMFNEMKALLGADGDEQHTFALSDRCSPVEFSDGTTSFSLPFIHACIVCVVMQFGPISKPVVAEYLKMKESDVKAHVDSLISTGIFSENENMLQFVGPPSRVIDECGEEVEAPQAAEDPIMFTNVTDQINAAIVHFLKPRRFATYDEIQEAVRKIVPSHFLSFITDEKIKRSLEKLIEGTVIMHHHRDNSYRYRKT